MAEIRAGNVRAVPLNDHCWQLQVLRVARGDGKRRSEGDVYWRGVERYPSTVGEAALQVFELAVKRSDADEVAELVEAVGRAREEICACLREMGGGE